jgi:type VI secretion system protein VasD
MKNLGRLVMIAMLAAFGGCSSPPPPPPVLTLNIIGSAGQNPDPSGHGNTVAVNLYQLAATGKFQSTDFYSLTGQEAATLGTDEMGTSEQILVAPGATLHETRPLKPTVTAIGLAVMFRDINNSTWRLVAPVAANGPSVVTLRINGLKATIGP